ncbi:DnaJ domain protein [uncultured archaeon]|nr:DnaJ domain protein [uncultured archaeon]
MSWHKNKPRKEKLPEVIKDIPIEDDPYWKVSAAHMDAHRIGRFLAKFEKFEENHPEWTEELLEGTPTFYCVLGIRKGTGKDEVEKAYHLKSVFSSYPDYILDESLEVLSDPKLQKEYDELLFVFEQMTKCIPATEKNDLIQMHSLRLNVEKDFVRMEPLMSRYKSYIDFYMNGMPDFYEISGLGHDSSMEEIKKRCDGGSELFKKIYVILGNPASREEYDFLMRFMLKFGGSSEVEKRLNRKKRWESLDNNLFEKIVLFALSNSEETEKFKKRIYEILKSNQDWLQYLPPNRETLFSMLGIDKNSLPDDKKEIEKVIRDKYRNLEKTPRINLAYTVLKNASQRDDYLYLMQNIDILDATQKILSDDEPVELFEPPGKMQKGKKMKGSKQKASYEQKTFDDMFEEIIDNILKDT